MQTASSKIWSRAAVSIFYEGNHYTMNAERERERERYSHILSWLSFSFSQNYTKYDEKEIADSWLHN